MIVVKHICVHYLMIIFNNCVKLFIQVASLKEKLTHEMKLREALKGCLRRSPGSLPQIPGYIPAEVRIRNDFFC